MRGVAQLLACQVEYVANADNLIALRSGNELRHLVLFEDADVVDDWIAALRDAM